MAPAAIERWSTTRSSWVSRWLLTFDAQHTDYNSGIGLQAGTATTVFDARNLCGRVQYYGPGSLDRIHACVFASSWASRHGLGSLFFFLSFLDATDSDRDGLPRVSSSSLSVLRWYVPDYRRLRTVLTTAGGYGVRDAYGWRFILVDTLFRG
jgi:hypothetical protein